MIYVNLNVIRFYTFTTKKTAYWPVRKKRLNQTVTVQARMERNATFWAIIQIFQR